MSWVQSKDVNLERFELVWTKIRVGTSQKGHKLRKEWVLASLQIYRSAEALWGCCEVRESNGSSANGAQRKGAILHTTNQWNLSQYVLKQDKHCPSTSSKHIQSISTSKLYQTSPNYVKHHPKSRGFRPVSFAFPDPRSPCSSCQAVEAHGTGIDGSGTGICTAWLVWDCFLMFAWLLYDIYIYVSCMILVWVIWLCDSMVVNELCMAVLWWVVTGKKKQISGIICGFLKCSILCQCAWIQGMSRCLVLIPDWAHRMKSCMMATKRRTQIWKRQAYHRRKMKIG